MAYTILSNLPENITYMMEIPYCGCFDWSVWLPMFILIFGWLGMLYMAEKRKDVVFAFCSIFFGLALIGNDLARSIFVIVGYPLVVIFVIISIYEFFIIALKR